MSLADAVRQYATTNIVCRRLTENARTGDIAAANVEPVTCYMPLWDFCHFCLPISSADQIFSGFFRDWLPLSPSPVTRRLRR
jgi:hypothetical protein